jgi:hypothetical protein
LYDIENSLFFYFENINVYTEKASAMPIQPSFNVPPNTGAAIFVPSSQLEVS